MSNNDNIIWHISLSPVNRYLLTDLSKVIGIAAVMLIIVQVIQIGNETTSLITTAGFGLIVIWGFILILKLFTSFNGHNIRFIIDENGATAMNNEGKIGLNYVTRQISSTGWEPDSVKTIKPLNKNYKKSYIAWAQVNNIAVDEKNRIITLEKKPGIFRIYCSENNFDEILCKVREKTDK